MRRVFTSILADEDLLEIWLHAARADLAAADRLLDRLDTAGKMLLGQPLSGRSREELGAGLRSWPVGRYVIFYRPVAAGVEIARVLHGARDLDLLF